jgi:hypothetical protein
MCYILCIGAVDGCWTWAGFRSWQCTRTNSKNTCSGGCKPNYYGRSCNVYLFIDYHTSENYINFQANFPDPYALVTFIERGPGFILQNSSNSRSDSFHYTPGHTVDISFPVDGSTQSFRLNLPIPTPSPTMPPTTKPPITKAPTTNAPSISSQPLPTSVPKQQSALPITSFPSPTPTSSNSASLTSSQLFGIIIGSSAGFLLTCCCCVGCLKRKKQASNNVQTKNTDGSESFKEQFEGDGIVINIENEPGAAQIQPTAPPCHYIHN